MLREVKSSSFSGRLFLSRMPGRYEPLETANEDILKANIDTVISLTPLEEIRIKAPEYAGAIEQESLPWKREQFPIKDFGVPADPDAFLDLARRIAGDLEDGKNIMIHCGAGIGRTGTLAMTVLMVLGLDQDIALQKVEEAGSGPEKNIQRDFIRQVVGGKT